MKKLFRIQIPDKLLTGLILLGFVLSLLPMLKAAQYNVMSADDVSYGVSTHQAWEETGSLAEVFKAAFQRTLDTYFAWQGSYTAVFLFMFQPGVFGEQYYFLTTYFMLAGLLGGIFYFVLTLFPIVFGASKQDSLIIACVISLICTQFLPRANQAFYWYNGSVYYTFFFGLSLIAYGLLIRFGYYGGAGKLITVSLLLVLIAGGNLVTGLTTAILFTSALILLFLKKHPRAFLMLIPYALFIAGFLVNVLAPGNAYRAAYYFPPDMWGSFPQAFREAAVSIVDWTSLPVIALLVFLAPILHRVVRNSKLDFRWAKWGTIYGFCLTAASFYPQFYAMGFRGEWRMLNVSFYTIVFLWVGNLVWWIGSLDRKGILKRPEKPGLSLVFVLCVLVLFVYGSFYQARFDVTDISAVKTYLNGDLGSYHHTYMKNLEVLKDPEVKDAVLKRTPVRPYLLFRIQVESSNMIAAWYHKDSVIYK